MYVNSLPKTATRQRRGCDLNLGPSAPESSTLTTRLPSHRRSMRLIKTSLSLVFANVHKLSKFTVFSLHYRPKIYGCVQNSSLLKYVH